MQHLTAHNENIGRLLLRAGIAFVFIWFGIDKFVHTDIWFAWIPAWLPVANNYLFMYALGAFETLLGTSLLLGAFTRACAAIAAIFFFVIILSFGLNEIMVRDAGLFFLTIALAFLGPGKWSIDWHKELKKTHKQW